MNKIKLNKNQCQVLATLYYNKKSGKDYMTTKKIKEECGFEKSATVTGCLLGLRYAGLVESKNQTLFDGTTMRFYYIPDEIMEKLICIATFEMED